MAVLDFILNCICLLLWLNWRSRGLTNLPRVPGIALIGTLKLAARHPTDRWPSSLVLGVVLLGRAILYAQFGAAAHWTPTLPLGPISLHFRSDMLDRMFLFSCLGFLLFAAIFYFSLLLLAGASRNARENPWRTLVRAHLGIISNLPAWLLFLMPFIATFLFWLALGSLFGAMGLVAPAKSFRHVAGQAGVIGLGAYLIWPYVIAIVLVLHIVSSYVYFGKAPFWNFITTIGQSFLRPLAPLRLRAGKIDLAPLLLLGLLVLIVICVPDWLTRLYNQVRA